MLRDRWLTISPLEGHVRFWDDEPGKDGEGHWAGPQFSDAKDNCGLAESLGLESGLCVKAEAAFRMTIGGDGSFFVEYAPGFEPEQGECSDEP